MAFRPNRRHYNAAYDPWYTKIDWRVKCTVCGFAGIDPERTQEPERAVYSIEITTGATTTVVSSPITDDGRESVFFGDTSPPTGAPAHTISNVGVFFEDTTPPVGAPAHTVRNEPVYFYGADDVATAPMYALVAEDAETVASASVTQWNGRYQYAAGTPVDQLGREEVYFGDTTPPVGAVAHTSSNVAVFFGDSEPPMNAPMHAVDGRPVFFVTGTQQWSAPMYVVNTEGWDTFTRIGGGAGCPFCGAANWSWAREPGLRW